MSQRLAILGVGLIGGSVGLAARAVARLPWHVVGYEPNPDGLRRAMSRGAIDEVAPSAAAAVADADLVVLAMPVGVAVDVLADVAGSLESGAVVTDVGSTKRSIVTAAGRLGVRFVGSHPMAGGDRGGVDHARAELLRDAVCVVTPTADTPADEVARVEWFWQSLGMRTVRLSPDEHDRRVASVSHAPHAVAAAVVRAATAAALPLAAGGYRDTTRVAGGDPALWRDILLDNRDHVRSAVERVRAELADLLARLDAGDAAAVQGWLETAADRRRGHQ